MKSRLKFEPVFYCEWEQLQALYNKNKKYNWYDITVIGFYIDYHKFNKDDSYRITYKTIWNIKLHIALIGFIFDFSIGYDDEK